MGIVDNALIGASGQGGYFLTRSLRFRASASAYLNRTFGTPTNNKIWTLSFWVKRGDLVATSQYLLHTSLSGLSAAAYIYFSNNTISYWDGSLLRASTQVFRDPSSWYHIIVAFDSTQATANNRVKMYINGVEITAFTTLVNPSLNYNSYINSATAHYISSTSSSAFDGYLTEVNFIDGQALTPSSFGSTNTLTGVWQPARYGGAYGTNGFYLPFTDNSALTTSSNVGLGKDFSGNGNYWITNNISITAGVTYDSMTDVPTLTSATAANFAVMNPLMPSSALSWGNLRNTASAASATIQINSGKWYFESVATTSTVVDANNYYVGITGGNFLVYAINGNRWNGSAWVAFGASYATGDVIGIAFDATAGTATFYKNNVSQGTQTGTGGLTVYPYSNITSSNTNSIFDYNFGQRPFAYTPPTSFVALNTFNLPTSTIVNGAKEMGILLYTGDGTTSKDVTGLSFQPDLTYVKNRSAASDPTFSDTLRGITKVLYTDATSAESTAPSFGYINSILSTGFNVNSGGGTEANFNKSGQNYVGWTWKAGQGTNTSNTSGTITSTVSVNASAGLSMVTYTGTGANATVGHGLGVAPSWIVVKQRNDSGTNWLSYHVSLGATQGISLDSTSAAGTSSTYWNNTAPTSSVFSLGTTTNVNRSTGTYVAYCWTPIVGFSAFGSYTGNGSTDGPFVYLGFRPKFVLIKASGLNESWYIYDSTRNTYNVVDLELNPNNSGAEATFTTLDFLSNGFKLRTTNSAFNSSGATYIYACFSENPFKNALAR